MSVMSKGREATLLGTAALLEAQFGYQPADTVLNEAIIQRFPGTIALVSSFGTESAVLLHLAAQIDRSIPVVFIDTGKVFGETKRYREILTQRLGLTDVRTIHPDKARLVSADPKGALWRDDPDLCCHLRKVEPLARALRGFDAWITGRKAYQGARRANLPVFQSDATHIKVNPLARWSAQDLQDYLNAHDLPRHPLEADGFASIGCMPCTDRITEGEDPRAGRWRGRSKTECGIHKSARTKLTAAPA
ncbi:MAG: phosphoadenylyl-sulfate reductase [Pseudomonadota bacterium]